MALYNFFGKAGEKIFKNQDDPRQDINSHLNKFDLPSDDLEIEVKEEKLSVSGKVADQVMREKLLLSLGNIFGISEVEENIEVENASEEAQFYTVESGDTLSKIAKEFYGNAMKYPEIFEANKPMLSHPDKIYPGQVLRIPKLD